MEKQFRPQQLNMRGSANIENVIGRRRSVAKLVVGDQDGRDRDERRSGGVVDAAEAEGVGNLEGILKENAFC